jgi:uncharacterized membrane protein
VVGVSSDERKAGLIDSAKDTEVDFLQVFIRPNRSLSMPAMWMLWAAYAALVLTIAAGFFWLGAWPVLPFAGLELAVLGGVLAYLHRHAEDGEILILDEHKVRIIRREAGRTHEQQFSRYWAKAHLLRADQDWYPSRLVIGSHGRFVEIGAAVGEPERRALYRRLKSLMGGGMA